MKSDELIPLVYNELRRLASRKLTRETPGQTLQATALVHEAYVRLVANQPELRWKSRGHFFAAAAEAMRRILVEKARHRETAKAGGGRQRLPLSDSVVAADDEPEIDVLALDEMIDELAGHDPQAAELVKLRYFAGFGHVEAAEVLGIERRAADRLWLLARTWLFRRLSTS
ncbi:ECF sigma factor [Caulifigura coniformis]|uniref:ECF sigma factor n=1 Tax=Caulifigura coniformis TaxID=2527983 RepID=A0A517SCJ1_9PLAN|nr:ECF-type sigma factor [Caulifigura coniformis]QDT53834.1 ECF sigma factor [Caulifigura coniformis]